jgi:hypothetical protein
MQGADVSRGNLYLIVAALAAALPLAGCGSGAETASSPVPGVNTAFSLARVRTSSALNDIHPYFDVAGGRVPASSIDSLLVTVTRIDVLPDSVLAACRPTVGDSITGFRPGERGAVPGGLGMGRPHAGLPCGPGLGLGRIVGPGSTPPGLGRIFARPDDPRTHADSLLPPALGWGSRLDEWYSVGVLGNGRIDLFHLPTDSAHGLVLAADTLPAGDYWAARLIVSDASVWFNTAIVTDDDVTLKPDTGYTVELPHRPGGEEGIMSTAGFTVPAGGGTVVLIFDADQMLSGGVVIHDGKVVLAPMLRPRL